MSWKPFPGGQTEFLSRGEFEVLYGGRAGPGKTDCLVSAATRFVGNAKYRALLLRRTFPQLQEIIDRCWGLYPHMGAVYKATEHRWYFPSGATVQLGHMQHETDKYNYQGKEFHFIGADELTQFLESQYLYLFSRLRTTDPDITPMIRATTNPGNIGHYWVKSRFIDIGAPGTTHIDPKSGMSRCFIEGTAEDNPALFKNDPGYVARLESLPEIEKMRLLHGIWDAFEGQVFTELSQRVHGCEPFEPPHEWEKFMVFDWGYAKPFSCGWYATDFDGNIWRYREWYGTKSDGDSSFDVGLRMSATDVARGILEREKEKVRMRIADPSIWNKTPRKDGPPGPSVFEDMAREGVVFIKADNNRLHGKIQVHKRLEIESEVDKDTGEITGEHPRFFVGKDQKHFWRVMQNMREDPKNPDDVDTHQEDHVYDEFRYACMFRPIKPKKVERIPEGSFAAERRRLIRAKEYARKHGTSLEAAYARVR